MLKLEIPLQFDLLSQTHTTRQDTKTGEAIQIDTVKFLSFDRLPHTHTHTHTHTINHHHVITNLITRKMNKQVAKSEILLVCKLLNSIAIFLI